MNRNARPLNEVAYSLYSPQDLETPMLGAVSRPRLNPAFVEWLMGLPIGWIASGPVETQSYLCRLRMRLFDLIREEASD